MKKIYVVYLRKKYSSFSVRYIFWGHLCFPITIKCEAQEKTKNNYSTDSSMKTIFCLFSLMAGVDDIGSFLHWKLFLTLKTKTRDAPDTVSGQPKSRIPDPVGYPFQAGKRISGRIFNSTFKFLVKCEINQNIRSIEGYFFLYF
jgi:hypothetical protein